MKTRTYCIITGGYDARVVGHVVGPATPALSTLRKQFEALYDTSPRVKECIPTGAGVLLRVAAEIDRETRAQAAGWQGNSWAELFVDWLKREHGYVEADVTEVYL